MIFLTILLLADAPTWSMNYKDSDRESKNVIDKRGRIFSLNNNEIAEVCDRGFLEGWFARTEYTSAEVEQARWETQERIQNMLHHSSHLLSEEGLKIRKANPHSGSVGNGNQSQACTILDQAIAAWGALCKCNDKGVQMQCSQLSDWHYSEHLKWISAGFDDSCFVTRPLRL